MSMRESIDGATREALLERGRVLLALYEGGLGFLRHAVAAHETNDAERFGHYVGRAEKVVQGLATTLDRDQGGELASILERLYEFMAFRLNEAARTEMVEPVHDVIRQLGRIYASYRQVIGELQHDRGAAPSGPAPAHVVEGG
jgi:flagellar protein FliS